MRVSTKGLEKSSGYSFEDVCQVLTEHDIPFSVNRQPSRTDHYFRASTVVLEDERSKYLDRVKEIFNKRSVKSTHLYCYGFYRPTPEFDFSVLNGHPRFRNGLLVESTLIC